MMCMMALGVLFVRCECNNSPFDKITFQNRHDSLIDVWDRIHKNDETLVVLC